jgi:exodeoxyribonuclease VII small subunit
MPKLDAETSEMTFEAALERLEHIVGQMESSKLPLEELLVRYEEGTRLIAVCNQRLEAAEHRIETLSRAPQAKAAHPVPDRPKEQQTLATNENSLF